MNARRRLVLGFLVVGLWAVPAPGYDLITHARISERAFDASPNLRLYLEDLGLTTSSVFDPDAGSSDPERSAAATIRFLEDRQTNAGTPRDWLAAGAIREDDYAPSLVADILRCPPPLNPPSPITRLFNHFFNLQQDGSGLPLVTSVPAPAWALGGSAEDQNQYSVLDARLYQARSLTEAARDERDRNAARLFRSLGQVVHVLQDMAQPQHVRNDPHPPCELVGLYSGKSWYEDYIEKRATHQTFRSRGGDPGVLALSGYGPVSFGTYRDYWTNDRRSGLADVASRNFLSAGTNFGRLVNPCKGLTEPPCDPEDPSYGREVIGYTATTRTGSTLNGDVTFITRAVPDPLGGPGHAGVRVSSRSLWDEHLEQRNRRARYSLNTFNYDAMADILLPRAAGYSAGLLDYFFRGRLDVGLEDEAGAPRMVGANASSERLGPGTLTVYAEDAAERRTLAGSAPVSEVVAGGDLPPVPVTVPDGTQRFVAVYQGVLGTERPVLDTPGAVLGRVFTGVRVEEIFQGAGHWYVRTPRGVFTLPLTTVDYEQVKWGDGASQLVALTGLGPGAANRIDAFDVERRPGSSDFATEDDGLTLKLTPQASGSIEFASPPVVSTLQFNQTIQYRQRIGRVDPHRTTFTWHPGPPDNPALGFCETRIDTAVVEFETVQSLAPTFSETIPLALDAAHNPALGGGYDPYYWQLMDFGVDRSGRLVGLVAILLDVPSSPGVSAPIVRLDARGQVETTPNLIEPYFPFEVTTAAWALVDLGAGTLIAATTDPTLTISSQAAQESVPTIYGHFVIENDGCAGFPPSGDGWAPLALVAPSAASHPIDARTPVEVTAGDVSLAVSGYMRAELAQELAPRALLSFETTDVFAGSSGGDAVYDCGESTCNAITLSHRLYLTQRPALKLWSGVRARPAPASGERVVFLGDADTPRFLAEGHLLVWDPGASARVRLSLRESFHNLSSATGSLATVVFSDEDTLPEPRTGSYLVPLDGGSPAYFDQENLGSGGGFVLLDPSYLYSTAELKFYRLQPPLQQTSLPAALATVPGNPRGDYHAVGSR